MLDKIFPRRERLYKKNISTVMVVEDIMYEQGISLEKLSEVIGIPVEKLEKWFAYKKMFSEDQLIKITDALDKFWLTDSKKKQIERWINFFICFYLKKYSIDKVIFLVYIFVG